MIAGAGSGKTTSLVKALDHLSRTRGDELRRNGQQVACITYTEVAVKEIWGDVGNSPLFQVSTIHSFIWSIVHPFHADIVEWVADRIDEKIAEATERLENRRTQQKTRETLAGDIERYNRQRASLNGLSHFTYGTGSNYAKGVLGHDDVLKIGPMLIAKRPLLGRLIARRFPFVFVDESQDTDPSVINALKVVASASSAIRCRKSTSPAPERFLPSKVGNPSRNLRISGARKACCV
jgi:DNA helicase-2/ATP-dependent DNA helicase PcrA